MDDNIKQVIQDNLLKAMINILKENTDCKDCPLVNELKRLPLDAEQAFFTNK